MSCCHGFGLITEKHTNQLGKKMPTKKTTKPIHLDFRSKETVVVVPDDEDRFVTTAGRAALACRQAAASKEWDAQWNNFLVFVHQWCEVQGEKVKSGYVSVGDTGLNVIICIASKDYDFSIEDAIVELDIALANQFPLCIADVMQIPDQRSLKTELSSEALLVYGDGERASKESGAQPVVS